MQCANEPVLARREQMSFSIVSDSFPNATDDIDPPTGCPTVQLDARKPFVTLAAGPGAPLGMTNRAISVTIVA